MKRPCASAVATLLLVGALIQPAVAQETVSGPEAARNHFSNGVRLYREGRTAQACEAFGEAYRAAPHYAVLYNRGQCLAQLGRTIPALRAFTRYLREGGPDVPDERRREIEREIRALQGQVGRIRFTVQPANATVRLDGQPWEGPLNREVILEPGTHLLEVSAEGHRSREEMFNVVPGQQRRWQVRLAPRPRPTGTLVLEANVPALVVTVNGNARRQLAQGQTIILPAGRHELEISRPGYETVRRSVRVAAERTRTIEVTLDPLQPLPSELAGVLEVHINHEGALITVDGRPLPDGPLPVGPHRLTVRHSNFLPWSRLVQVVPGSTVVQRVQLEPTPGFRALQDRRSRWWRIGTGATLSVALATLGATFCLLVWNSIRDQEWTNERNELRADFAQVVDAGQDTRALQVELERNAAHGEDLQAWASAEWALFAVGLTAAIASAVLLLRENKSRRAGLRWRPAAGGFSLAWGGPQGSQGSP